jgi:hypothetical protein
MQEEFLNKTGKAVQQLSGALILLKKGCKMPLISDFEEQFDMARGTVQNALAYLKEEAIIATINKGRQGTILTEIDYGRLQKIVLNGTLRGTMPLPYSKLYEGFATGLYENFSQAGIPLSMAYVRGSKERIDLVIERTMHFSIVSKLAAMQAIEEGSKIEIIKDFGVHSYLSQHVLIFANSKCSEIKNGMKVGIDHHSYDQQMLTEQATKGKDVVFVEIPSYQLIYSLENGIIDVGIWNYDEIKDRKLKHLNYQVLAKNEIGILASTAVCIARKDNQVLNQILINTIDEQCILAIQAEVMAGKIIPHY